MADSKKLESIHIDVADFLYRMDRAAAVVESVKFMVDSEFRTYTPSIVLDLAIEEIADLKNIIDVASINAGGAA